MRASTIAYILRGCTLAWVIVDYAMNADCWQDPVKRAYILNIWARSWVYFTYYVNYLIYSRYIAAFFDIGYSEHLIDEPEICGVEFCWTIAGTQYSFFLVFLQDSWMARLFWLARRSILGIIKAIDSAVRLTGAPVPAILARFDHVHA